MNLRNIFFNALIIISLSLVASCNGGHHDESAYLAKEKAPTHDQAAPEIPTAENEKKTVADSAYRVINSNLEAQKGRKFIRTAETKFKVKNVQKATQDIEDLSIHYQGFITHGDLKTQINNITITPISADSLLETKFFQVSNDLTIRVPNQKLDSLLRDLNKLIDFLDYRLIQADDVSLSLLANTLRSNRFNQFEKRYVNAIDTKSQKLGETTNAEDNLLNRQNQADDVKIQNLSLEDQVNYSTLKIHIYQRETTRREMIENYKNIASYRPSLLSRIGESLEAGWYMVEEFILFLSQIWAFILIGIGAFVLYQKFYKKPIKSDK